MSWQNDMVTIVRYLIDDVDISNYDFSSYRLETTILVAASLTFMDVDFKNTYDINIGNGTLSPDPTEAATKDNAFITLVSLRAACIILGSIIRSESGNAISIKDGPSAIDLRGVTNTLMDLYKDLCSKYDTALLEYKSGNPDLVQAILGPYSPASQMVSRTGYHDDRAGGFLNY